MTSPCKNHENKEVKNNTVMRILTMVYKVPPQALAEGVSLLVNPARLTYAEVRTSMAQTSQTITM